MSANKRKIGALVAGLGIAGVFCYKVAQQYKLAKADENEFKEEKFEEETVTVKMNVNDIIDDKEENDESEHSLKEDTSLEDDIEKQINMQKEEADSKKK